MSVDDQLMCSFQVCSRFVSFWEYQSQICPLLASLTRNLLANMFGWRFGLILTGAFAEIIPKIPPSPLYWEGQVQFQLQLRVEQ